MNVLGRIFLNSRKERRKDVKTDFFVRCRRTYVLKKTLRGRRVPKFLQLIRKLPLYKLSSLLILAPLCQFKGAYWISLNSSFIQYCDSNIGLFSIVPALIIALPTLR